MKETIPQYLEMHGYRCRKRSKTDTNEVSSMKIYIRHILPGSATSRRAGTSWDYWTCCPATFKPVLKTALKNSDGFVWIYCEFPSWWLDSPTAAFGVGVRSRDDHTWIDRVYWRAIERARQYGPLEARIQSAANVACGKPVNGRDASPLTDGDIDSRTPQAALATGSSGWWPDPRRAGMSRQPPRTRSRHWREGPAWPMKRPPPGSGCPAQKERQRGPCPGCTGLRAPSCPWA